MADVMEVTTMKKFPNEPPDKTLVRVYIDNRERRDLEWSYVFERDDETTDAFEPEEPLRRWHAQGLPLIKTWRELCEMAVCIEVLVATGAVLGERPCL